MGKELTEESLRKTWEYFLDCHNLTSIPIEKLEDMDNDFWKLFNSGFEEPLSYPIKKEKKNA